MSMRVTVTVDDATFDVVGDYEPGERRNYGHPDDREPDIESAWFRYQAWLHTPNGLLNLDTLPPDMVAEAFWDQLDRAALAAVEVVPA